MSRNLLMIDFDYFFNNPLESGDVENDSILLYDWGHSEAWNPAFLNAIWISRAAAFMYHDMPLPDVKIPDNWWQRFNISRNARVEVSDSNMYSGIADGEAVFDNVWLFDAHHDLYKIETEDELQEWEAAGRVSCEDWMYAHWLRGSALHWRWPQWHQSGEGLRDEIPEWVGCDAHQDDMRKLDVQFDVVSICRSGSWVPPWCDDKFEEFVRACPGGDLIQVDNQPRIRDWDVTAARLQTDIQLDMMSRAESEANNKRIAEALKGLRG